MRIFAVSFLILVLALSGAAASENPDRGGAPGTNVEMPFLIAPMSKDGKLLGYAYISCKMVATSQSAAIDIRDKLAFIQDAFVRDVNAHPIATDTDPTAVDTVLLNARLVEDARRIIGQGKVDRMVFVDDYGHTLIKFAPLHPGESTLNLVPPSEQAPAPAAGREGAVSDAGTAAKPAAMPATPEPAKDSTH